MRLSSIDAPPFNLDPSPLHAQEWLLAMLAAGRCFGAFFSGTAAAANKAVAELNNPNASGKSLYVYALDTFVPVAQSNQIVLDGTTVAPATVPNNLLVGGAASIAKVGGSNQNAPTGSLIYATPALTANAIYTIPLPYFVVIPPNHNLQVIGQTVNQVLNVNARWVEL